MERETLVTLLIMMSGGLMLQLLGAWPVRAASCADPAALERQAWRALCRPVAPVLVIAAWLVGWALTEPDPVRDPLDPGVVVWLWLPFGLLFARASVRAAWALVRELPECVSTIGFLRPLVVFSPFLARQLDEPVLRAALAHERAHARHRDPLRIWVAQVITDLQWPWPQAQRRLTAWLAALELARDEEARCEGIDGSDLAEAVLASARFLGELPAPQLTTLGGTQLAHARLIGDETSLRHRVSQLLAPLPAMPDEVTEKLFGLQRMIVLVLPLLLAAMLLGAVSGQRIMQPLLGLTS
jgi:hypothetical protein